MSDSESVRGYGVVVFDDTSNSRGITGQPPSHYPTREKAIDRAKALAADGAHTGVSHDYGEHGGGARIVWDSIDGDRRPRVGVVVDSEDGVVAMHSGGTWDDELNAEVEGGWRELRSIAAAHLGKPWSRELGDALHALVHATIDAPGWRWSERLRWNVAVKA